MGDPLEGSYTILLGGAGEAFMLYMTIHLLTDPQVILHSSPCCAWMLDGCRVAVIAACPKWPKEADAGSPRLNYVCIDDGFVPGSH